MTKLNKFIKKSISEGIVSNIAVKVGRFDEVLYEEYFSKDGKIDKNTLFDMASVTKIMATAPLTFIAKDRGLLSFDDRVSEFFSCPEDKKDLTIRHILTHSTGINHRHLYVKGNNYDNIQDYIINSPLVFTPGKDVIYSCLGFILMGKIIDKVFGKTLKELFNEEIAIPLGLKNTGFHPDEKINIINANIDSAPVGIVNDFNSRFLGGAVGNAGIFSDMEDMTRYAEFLLNKGAPIISEETFSEAMKNYTPGMTESRGLGFICVDKGYRQTGELFEKGGIGHCGHTGQSVFVDVESGLYVIILSDITATVTKREGFDKYEIVTKFREDIHNIIKKELNL